MKIGIYHASELEEHAKWLQSELREVGEVTILSVDDSYLGYNGVLFLGFETSEEVPYFVDLAEELDGRNTPYIWAIEGIPNDNAYDQVLNFEQEDISVILQKTSSLPKPIKKKKELAPKNNDLLLKAKTTSKKLLQRQAEKKLTVPKKEVVDPFADFEIEDDFSDLERPTNSPKKNSVPSPSKTTTNKRVFVAEEPVPEEEYEEEEYEEEIEEEVEEVYHPEPTPSAKTKELISRKKAFQSDAQKQASIFDEDEIWEIENDNQPYKAKKAKTTKIIKGVIAVASPSNQSSSSFVAWNLASLLRSYLIEGNQTGPLYHWLAKYPDMDYDRSRFLHDEVVTGLAIEATEELTANDLESLEVRSTENIIVIHCSVDSVAWNVAQQKILVVDAEPSKYATKQLEGVHTVLFGIPKAFPIPPSKMTKDRPHVIVENDEHEFLISKWTGRPWILNQPKEIQDSWKSLVQEVMVNG